MFIPAKPLFALAAACALMAGCAPAPAGVVAMAPETPLETVLGYRLQASLVGSAAPIVAVNGVAPPVSGRAPDGRSFMLRPETHEIYSLDAKGGTVSWGGLGAEPGRFNQPSSLVVTEDRVYVADTRNHRIQAFDFSGKFVAAWGTFGNAVGQLNHPRSIEVTPGGTLVVVDDARLQYFAPDGACLGEMPLLISAGRAVTAPTLSPTGTPMIADMSQGVQQDIYAFMALYQQMAQEMRNGAREARTAEMAAQVAALNDAAAQIREAAATRFAAAVVQGTMQVAAGAGAIAVGAGGVKPLSPQVGGLTARGAISAGVEGRGSGIMRAAGDIGTVKEIADRKETEADAKAHEEATRQADEMMRQMQDLIREVREKLQAIEESRVETNRGIARNI